jgi:hypothetical protein
MYSKKITQFISSIPKKYIIIVSWTMWLFVLFSIIFARPFVGLNLFGYLIGELAVGGLFLASIIFMILPNAIFQNIEIKLLVFFKIIVFLFFFTVLYTQSNLLTTYTYKASSYIWTMVIFFVGYYVLYDFSPNKAANKIILLILPYTYLISTGNYPDFLINFFKENSDKFQFIKASDLAIGLFVTLLLVNKNNKNKRFTLFYTLCSISVFIPVMLFNSRGSIIALIIFATLFCLYEYEIIASNKIFSLGVFLFSLILFFSSAYRVYGNLDFYKEPESMNIANISEAVSGIVKNKDTSKVFLSFYIQDGYLMSWDATTDWRLDIWQDVFYDLKQKRMLTTGYGYSEIIPVMLDPTAPGRLGRDGLNENVHNYFVNILARGGVSQLTVFLIFYVFLIRQYKIKHGNYKILVLILPTFLLSSLDVTMEGVHFPFIFFSYLGYSLREGI